jgi:hypothetical protein
VIKGENVKETSRLALCNYDWMNVTAKDLMLLFSSFKPSQGTIVSVSVYYSQFGRERLEKEEKFGPQGIWSTEEEHKDKPGKVFSTPQNGRHSEEEAAFNNIKLREYEKQRIKYCYAVIECNSKQTADEIYKECDGTQF